MVDSSMVTQFNNSAHHCQEDMTVTVSDQVYSHNSCLRKIQQNTWIRTVGTASPLRINLGVNTLQSLKVPSSG